MSMTRVLALLALAATVLSGCAGGETGTVPIYRQIFDATAGSIQKNRARKAAPPPLTRAALAQVTDPYVEVTLERSGITAYLFQSTRRHDEFPGEIVQWRTEDEVTVTTRAGMVIATRGLGGDLMSASAPAAAGRVGPVSGGERLMDVRTGALELAQLTLACELEDRGPATVEIVELRHSTRHLVERCAVSGGGRIENEYWVDQGAGIIWQSVQWAGPHVGYLTLRRLTK